MYKYGNIEDAKPGDIVECTHNFFDIFTKSKLYIVSSNKNKYEPNFIMIDKDDKGSTTNGWRKGSFKLVKTKPGTEAKVGDTVIRIKGGTSTCPTGTVFTVLEADRGYLLYASSLAAVTNECKVLCKAEPISTEKRNLAFYKCSGEPWTNEECENIVRYVGAPRQIKNKDWGTVNPHIKYMYDDNSSYSYMATWSKQERDSNFKNCKQVAYEDVFKTPHSEENTDTPRVAIVTRDVCGHPVGSRIVPVDAENTLWKLINDPSSKGKAHTLGHNCEWEDINTLKHCKNIYHESQVSPATSCSLLQPTVSEEEPMNHNVTIAMTAKEYNQYQKQNKPTDVKTDLEQAPEWLTIWYGADERKIHQTTQSPKQARKALQKPDSLGYTFRSYLITKSASTAIPVVDIAV